MNKDNLMIKCECGCGIQREKVDKYGIVRKFVKGHNAWKVSDSREPLTKEEWNLKNRYRYYKTAVEKRRERKTKAISYMGGKCEKCGYNKSNRALTFHHKQRQDKEYNISKILDYSWDKLQSELDKCVMLCMNCHMEAEDFYEDNKV